MKTDKVIASKEENQLEQYSQAFHDMKDEIGKVVIGQEEMIELMILTLLSSGHILLEGVPGLAKSLASPLFRRSHSLFVRDNRQCV